MVCEEGEGAQTYRSVQIQDIDAIRAQLRQARLDRLDDLVARVLARFAGIVDLGGESEATFLPLGFPCEGFLLAADVDAGRVDLVVPAGLEQVETPDVLGVVRNACSRGLVGPKGHQAQDHPARSGLRDKRHVEMEAAVGCLGGCSAPVSCRHTSEKVFGLS